MTLASAIARSRKAFSATDDPRPPTRCSRFGDCSAALEFSRHSRNATEELARSAAGNTAKRWSRSAPMAALNSLRLTRRSKPFADRKRAQADHVRGIAEPAWFKHQLYAPGFYTGYALKTVPRLCASHEQKAWKQAG